MNQKFIPVNKPLIENADVEAVAVSLRDGWISGEGPVVEGFEQAMAARCSKSFGIALCNGTVAIDLAYEAIGIKQGDEVIVPSFTIISCISYLLRVGAKPIFVDSDPITWNMNVDEIESKISTKTKAILVPHIYGLPVDMDPLTQIAKKYNLFVIEDAAEAHGLNYKGKECGSFGDISTFSFYANKNITTGEGGMVLTDDLLLANKVRNLRNLNFRINDRFISDELGYNYRMSSMQAALGASQLERINQIIEKRKQLGNFYTAEFAELENVQLPVSKTEFSENAYWVYGIKLAGKLAGRSKEFQQIFQNSGIGTRPFFQPLHKQPVLAQFDIENSDTLPVAEDLGASGFYIPNGLGMLDSEVEAVVSTVKKILKNA